MGIELFLPFLASLSVIWFFRKVDGSGFRVGQLKKYSQKLQDDLDLAAMTGVQAVKDATIDNLKEKDAELVERILDHLEIDNDDDSDDDSDDEGNEGGNEEEEENMLDVSKYDGNKIDSELSALLDQGVTEINFMEIRSACPHTYELLFEAYEANKENGVRTSHFEMIETEPNSETFYISKL